MSGFFADADLTPNRIELARQQTKGYVDLTSSNPTHQGLIFPSDILQVAAGAYLATRSYEPDSHGNLAARQAIMQFYAERTPALAFTPDDLFITASTSEAYGLLFALLCDPGDNVLAPNVSYPLFEYLADIYRVELRPYRLDEANDWRIDPESLRQQVDSQTRAILIVSPHNPTGMTIQAPDPTLIELGLPVICDEVFSEFPYAVEQIPPFGALHPQLPVFHLNGISKMFALPDLKLGWIALSGTASATYGLRLELLNDTFLGANSLTQAMLPTLFAQGRPFIRTMQSRIRENLDLARSLLVDCPQLRIQPPQGGYYLFPTVDGWEDEEELVLQLLQHGVLVHPGYFYGEPEGCHLMLSCLTEPTRLRVGLERLREGLQTLHRQF